MEINMPKLPFGILPGHWGLAGKTREIAQAEYELTGYDLEVRLLEIKKDEYTDKEYSRKLADLGLKYNKCTESEYHRLLTNFIDNEKQRSLAVLELDRREGKITELEFQKTTATLNDEPWVTVLNMDFGKKSALEGSFELDWNDQFVDKLKAEGYVGPTPDAIVNQWFMEVCRNVAMEEFDGTGDFTADSEANLEAVKRWQGEKESFPDGRKGYK
jgi:hypothetical protein